MSDHPWSYDNIEKFIIKWNSNPMLGLVFLICLFFNVLWFIAPSPLGDALIYSKAAAISSSVVLSIQIITRISYFIYTYRRDNGSKGRIKSIKGLSSLKYDLIKKIYERGQFQAISQDKMRTAKRLRESALLNEIKMTNKGLREMTKEGILIQVGAGDDSVYKLSPKFKDAVEHVINENKN